MTRERAVGHKSLTRVSVPAVPPQARQTTSLNLIFLTYKIETLIVLLLQLNSYSSNSVGRVSMLLKESPGAASRDPALEAFRESHGVWVSPEGLAKGRGFAPIHTGHPWQLLYGSCLLGSKATTAWRLSPPMSARWRASWYAGAACHRPEANHKCSSPSRREGSVHKSVRSGGSRGTWDHPRGCFHLFKPCFP